MSTEYNARLEEALKKLDGNRGPFIAAVKRRVFESISHESRRNCTAIRAHSSNGRTIDWDITDTDEYVKRFVKFVKKNDSDRVYHGEQLDSYLTDGIVEIVCDEYKKYINNNIEEVGNALRSMMAKDQAIIGDLKVQLVMTLKNSTTPLTNIAVNHLAEAILQSLDITGETAAVIGHNIATFMGTAAGKQVAIVIAHAMSGPIGVEIAHAVGTFLASAAGKKLLIMIVKKMAAKAVITAVAPFLAAAFGVSIAGPLIWWIVLPMIAVWMAIEIHDFPIDLAKKVSEEIENTLENETGKMNRSVVNDIFKELTKAGAKDLAKALVGNPAVKEAMKQAVLNM
ncbi:hypothetical protein BGZ60DRAFT_420549 [Tricladium varicosporioides]|nr:hypothetical protein BGZ60DRAFT_420549 [Hymenoscyphus varicosporioides]